MTRAPWLAVVALAAIAQTPEAPRQQVVQRFEQATVPVGQPLPQIALHDAEGRPFHTRQLVGSYTVLVTGCLT